MRWWTVVLAAILGTVLSLTSTAQELDNDPATQPTALPRLDNDAMKQLGWRLACVAACFHDRTTYEMAVLLKAMNLRHVELSPGQVLRPGDLGIVIGPEMPAADVDWLLATLKGMDIDVVSYGVVTADDPARLRRDFQFAAKLSARVIVFDSPDRLLPLLDQLAGEFQIDVAIINHPRPGNHWSCQAMLRALRGRSKRLGVYADIGNWRRSGLVPADCLRILHGHITEIHLSDVNDLDQPVPFGGGTCGAMDVLRELQRQNFKGVCGIDCSGHDGAVLVNDFLLSIDAFTDAMDQLANPSSSADDNPTVGGKPDPNRLP